jgi:hypothetical protein
MRSHLLNGTTLLAGLGALALIASPAAAQEATGFSHEGAVELTYDHATTDEDVVALTVNYNAAFRFAEGWTVQVDAVLEPVEDPVGDAAFEGQDAFIETLSLQYAGEGFTLYAGKINPVFGSAADLAPGLYGVEVGEDYQITEQVGFGGDILLPLPVEGEHVLSAALFAADRTLLSGSVGARRERLRLEDGGLANTESLKSFAVSLDGALDNGIGYTLGHRRLASDTLGEADESATVAGISYVLPEDTGLDLVLLAEVAASRDANGIAGANRDFFTTSATWGVDGWSISAIVSGWNENALAGDADTRKYEVSVGRDLMEGLTLDLGAQHVEVAGDSEAVLGARLTFGFN